FSGIGLYPVCPGKPDYALSSPIFDEVRIKTAGGEFVIHAQGAGDGMRYIQSAALNGMQLNRAFLTHGELESGGELVLTMGPRPNKSWGTGH
nr:glycoside hydrolase family 92 protein [Clostridiales bacterium]